MGFLIFLTVLVFIAASAVGCFPDKQKMAQRLSATACVMMTVTVILSLVVREGMFSDFAALPQGMLIKAVLAVAVSIASGAALTLFLVGKKDNK